MAQKIAIDFSIILNFPNCVDSIDGKKIGSKFKFLLLQLQKIPQHYTIVCLWSRLSLRCLISGKVISLFLVLFFIFQKLEIDFLKIFPATALPNCDVQLPYCFVGGDAFPLKSYLMKPYPGRCTGTVSEDLRVFKYG